jgi:PAS domain S-box-containing protein
MAERSPAHAWPSVTRPMAAMLGTIAVVLVVHPAWMVRHFGGDHVTTLVDDLVPVVAATLAVVLTARRARLPADRLTRLGWMILSASCAGLAGGQAVYAVYELVLRTSAPFPSLADPLYVCGTSLGIPAVLLLGGRALVSSRLRLLLDGGIVALGVLLVSWLTVLETVWRAGGTDPFTFVLGLFYPIGDVVTVVIVLSTLSNARRLNPALLIVGAGMLCFAFSDSTYAYLTAVNQYSGSNPIDVGWVAGYLLIGLASLVGRGQRPVKDAQLSRWQIALPYAPLLAAVVVVMANLAGDKPIDFFSQLMLGGLVALVLGRQLAAVIESQSLASRLTSTSAEREILIERAPVGICRLDRDERLVAANLTFLSMLGYSSVEIAGRSLLELLDPVDRSRAAHAYAALQDGSRDQLEVESRFICKDGSSLWTSQLAAVVRDSAGQPESFITIVENVTERRRQVELAAHIQRQLLPQATPRIDGYQLTGTCLPSQDVAGDFYDWVVTEGGCIDLTVADVMGKGVGAGLVMATMRAVLRAAPPALGPADRVRVAADSMVGMDTGLFVTMIHARFDPASGVLRYVDAGHGYCAIRRLDGGLEPLSQRSLPLGVLADEMFYEETAHLGPGDALIMFSDGLVERPDYDLALSDLLSGVDRLESAAGLAGHLMDGVPARPADDVTVLVLRREPEEALVGPSALGRGVPRPHMIQPGIIDVSIAGPDASQRGRKAKELSKCSPSDSCRPEFTARSTTSWVWRCCWRRASSSSAASAGPPCGSRALSAWS